MKKFLLIALLGASSISIFENIDAKCNSCGSCKSCSCRKKPTQQIKCKNKKNIMKLRRARPSKGEANKNKCHVKQVRKQNGCSSCNSGSCSVKRNCGNGCCG